MRHPAFHLHADFSAGLGFVYKSQPRRSGSNAARSQAETQLEVALVRVLRFWLLGSQMHRLLRQLGACNV